ncbi:CHAT domain-containing protein [Bradyrhizobium genomosp. I (2014)]|uniref:CHAT domain-containing protein n=1 Tax=Bradyrhizobium genomosp. I (2014) TaxID=2683269 RepID=UPI0004AF4276|nr:CHAT domain-containing protein [Bradyrhizobium sp. CCBAU 43298]MDA9426431.1 hypothetical protein [Bradyrhizobium sp. CCBAU 53380]
MNVLFICNDPTMQLMVQENVEGANFRTLANVDVATQYLETRVPDVALIDPETGVGRQGDNGVRTFLERFSALDARFGSVVMLRAPGSEYEVEAVRNPRVWTWNTCAGMDGGLDPWERLNRSLEVASSAPKARNFRAIVTFTGDAVTLSVEENGISVIRDRPLLTDADSKATLEAMVIDDLEPSEIGDLRKTWRSYKSSGCNAFNALFGPIGKALISNEPNESVEFRFDMEPMQFQRRFALPLELIALAVNDRPDGFLCNLRPMARRALHIKKRPANGDHLPHILFVNAGSAEGEFSILGDDNPARRWLPSIRDSTDAQRERLEDLRDRDLCTLEELTLEGFNERCEARGVKKARSFRNALERRLCEPTDEDTAIDILHFAGHGISQRQTETRLILPAVPPRPDEAAKDADLLEVRELAGWLPDNVRVVFLAACQSASISAAEHLHLAKGCSLVGFRWKVVAKRIPDFVSGFYDAHLRERKSVAGAYRAACQKAQLPEDPAWVSAVALAAD